VTVSDIVTENKDRRAEMDAAYDPITGVGSPVDRVKVPTSAGHVARVPVRFAHEYPEVVLAARRHGSYASAVKAQAEGAADDDSVEAALAQFHKRRARHDFEYWAATAATIELDTDARAEADGEGDGGSGAGSPEGPLVLNRAQRLYWRVLHRQWSAGEPVRIILLKARQWGGSTLTQCFFAWVQRYHRERWHSFICNLSLDQAREIRGMYTLLAEEHGGQWGTITMAPYEGSSNIRRIEETGSIVGVTSIERPDSPRSYNIHLAHLSEVGLWPSTPTVNAEDFAQAITGAVDNEPHTVIVEESTARGVGTYFHGHWQDAGTDASSYERVFVAWHDIPKYQTGIEDPAAYARQALRPDRGEDDVSDKTQLSRRLWSFGATLQGIKWYHDKLADFKGKLHRMRAEYPSTPEEAFQSTGHRFFPIDHSTRVRQQARMPASVGRLRADGEDGSDALTGIEFVEHEDEDLKVWRRPGEKVWHRGTLLTPEDGHVARRFCAYVDFGGKTQQADYSVITIGDRIKMLRGGPVEVVARLRTHMRPDRFAWASARLAQWYGEALLIYEINRHRRDRGDEVRGFDPEWSLTVIREVMTEYGNLYLREVPDRVDEKEQLKVGFHLNQSTKPMILNALERGLDPTHGQTFVDPDSRLADEMDTFERKEDGRLGAVEGNYDDVVISAAGTAWAALSDMEPPAVTRPTQTRRPEPSPAQF
jgi:hypothetical protein